jgi:archaellum biogenesis ATPase FlaH
MSLHENLVQAIRSRKAKKHNDRWSFQCPRHDDRNPSAWMGDGAWGCMSCGFKEPLDTLANELGVLVEASGGYTLETYADAKGFPLTQLQKFGLTTEQSKGYNVVAIPYYDADGEVLRRRFRSERGKWWEGRNQPIYLYGIWRLGAAQKGAPVLIVEGESDCHAAWLHGFTVVGVPGATTWQTDWAEHLAGFSDIYVWEEPDQGGAQLVASIARSFPDAKVITPPDGVKDLADLRKKATADFADRLRALFATAVKIGTPKPPVAFDALLTERLNALYLRKLEPIDAVQTPWPSWNERCGGDGGKQGLSRGWHIIAAARTGAGKSILALNLAAGALTAGERVCFVSLEMEQGELETRMLAIATNTPVWRLEKGQHFNAQLFREAGHRMLQIHEQTGGMFFSNREPIHSLDAVLDSIRYNHEVLGSRYFIVDYLQLAGNAMDPESIAQVSHGIRKLAKDLRVITVGLSQFNRSTSASPERPTKEGLMGGSPLENDADQVLLIDHSRRRVTVEGWSSYGLLEKNRHGALAEIPIEFNTQTLRMREVLPDELPAEDV